MPLDWKQVWDTRYAELAQAAGLSERQAHCYRLHLRGLLAHEIADEVLGVLTMPKERKARKGYWRVRHRREQAVACAIGQAETLIRTGRPGDCIRAELRAQRDTLRCARNRLTDWSFQPIGYEQMACEDDRTGHPAILTADDFPKFYGRGQGPEILARNLAEAHEQQGFALTG